MSTSLQAGAGRVDVEEPRWGDWQVLVRRVDGKESVLDWVVASLSNALVFAGVSVLDKRILAVHTPGLLSFYFMVGLIQVGMALVAALAVPWAGGASAGSMAAAVGSGVAWGVTLVLFFYGLRVLEVSRVTPVAQTFPVLVAILAVAFLNESLTLVHWAAILAVVAGGVLITFGQGRGSQGQSLVMPSVLVFLSSATTAIATVLSKVALRELAFWNVYAIRSLFLGAVLLLAVARPPVVPQMRSLLRDHTGLAMILVAEAVLAPLGVYFMLAALEGGPASLASTLMSTRPLWVLAMSAALSTPRWNVLNEPLSRNTWVLKLASTLLIVGGVGLLSLA